jgi:chromosomal replication initiator protein
VLGADSHPRRLAKVQEELKSRFVSGMVAKLDPPNHEMRRRILREKAVQRQMELAPEVIDFLAERLHANVCELEGAINFLQHYQETMQTELNLATAQTALAEVLRHSSPVLRVTDVQKKACELFNINTRTLKDRSRAKAVAHPRMFVLFLARKHTNATYSEIGQQVGGLNHSTVISAEKKIRIQIERDGEILLGDRSWKVRDAVEAFDRELGSAS